LWFQRNSLRDHADKSVVKELLLFHDRPMSEMIPKYNFKRISRVYEGFDKVKCMTLDLDSISRLKEK
jgi:hypothetical protein